MEVSLEELWREVEELRASRARLVAAADAERRWIERELHDGAQQHFVALAVNLQLVRQLADSDLDQAKRLLEEIARDVRDALEGVRELAQRVYPPLLLDRGLAEALGAAASAADIPTRVEAAALDRFPPDVEAAVYFCCVEALHNASEHAGRGGRATLTAWSANGELHFEVADDGVGFDQLEEQAGAGLTAMSDRVSAIGGRLTIVSKPGHGTRVSGTIAVVP